MRKNPLEKLAEAINAAPLKPAEMHLPDNEDWGTAPIDPRWEKTLARFVKKNGAQTLLEHARDFLKRYVGTDRPLHKNDRRRVRAALNHVRGHNLDIDLWLEVEGLLEELSSPPVARS